MKAAALSGLSAWGDLLGPTAVYAAGTLVGDQPPEVQLAAALAIWAPLNGHTCIDLADVAQLVGSTLDVNPTGTHVTPDVTPDTPPDVAAHLPDIDHWLAMLRRCHRVALVDPDDLVDPGTQPFVLSGSMLYTQRQWVDERCVADHLNARVASIASSDDRGDTERDDPLDDPLDDQQRAIASARSGLLTVIVGGPGTGKTFVIGQIVAEQFAAGRRVLLAAPTGKAAVRLTEAVANDAVTAMTVHRVLGRRPGVSTRFRHDADNSLDADIVVVDEASMVSLAMMARLLDAVAPSTRLVLVGDPGQLESVDNGSVLADIVRAGTLGGAIGRRIVELSTTRRQAADSRIPALARAIHDGVTVERADFASDTTASDTTASDVTWVDFDGTDPPLEHPAMSRLVAGYHEARRAAHDGDADRALTELQRVRLLCAHRRGPFGVAEWNRLLERKLFDAGYVPRWYVGRPLLVTRNDRRLGLHNGDTGIVVSTPSGLRAAFRTGVDTRAGGGQTTDDIRLFSPVQLDAVETALAMTVHKSQGSEYDTVVVVVPPVDSPLATRELLYTAVTRTRRQLVVVGTDAAVAACIANPARRAGGLATWLGAVDPAPRPSPAQSQAASPDTARGRRLSPGQLSLPWGQT